MAGIFRDAGRKIQDKFLDFIYKLSMLMVAFLIVILSIFVNLFCLTYFELFGLEQFEFYLIDLAICVVIGYIVGKSVQKFFQKKFAEIYYKRAEVDAIMDLNEELNILLQRIRVNELKRKDADRWMVNHYHPEGRKSR